MQKAHYEHEQSAESVYRIFRSALARKKFSNSARIVAGMINNSCDDENYDWSEFISFCSLDEAKMFWTLVSEELNKNKD